MSVFYNINNNKANNTHSHSSVNTNTEGHDVKFNYQGSDSTLTIYVDSKDFLQIPYRGRRQCMTSNGSVWDFANISGSYLELVTSNGAKGINYSFSSDERIKMNIKDASHVSALDYLKKIKYYSYDWKDPEVAKFKGHTALGYIAQNLRDVSDEFTFEIDQSNCENAEYDSILNIDDQKLLPYITKAIVELSEKINALS